MYVVFFLFWLMLNGHVTLEIVLVGLFLSGLLYLFVWKFMGYSPKKEFKILCRLPKIIIYFLFLIKEIIVSSFQTIHFIWSPSEEVEPKLVSFKTKLKSKAGKTALGNSITLTPGTITVAIKDDMLLVHALDSSFSVNLEGSEMEEKLLKIEGGKENVR
ncbi:MAG: Na+/H+ antiporter subunit E [Lachnospiraceae bacterium]|nr:Na+/H+ antiporter subunit E [Lachnospiraceae bacterium]